MGFPDYYAILNLEDAATSEAVEFAYRQLAILYHPDNPQKPGTPEECHERYQQLADAYYILSDKERRKSYDRVRGGNRATKQWQLAKVDASSVFANVYEDLLKPEMEKPSMLWSVLGGISGATLGFIAANIPGALAGSVAGANLGRLRDIKGQSVYDTFMQLDDTHRQTIIVAVSKSLAQNVGIGSIGQLIL
ncbi:DnaJ domain-containing protein [Thamnocephalis sphaerospora]|uniref:DnaJ domain-containing protein n=1 Tax=Thamnocephalis sphaerospora TaxID=78915 RepID=A0A4P9XLX2_9FUNG|nr:DnaJ domain-containing protein [Thamnocephalis sphaerospora]|eukprot:RKP06826.1 DnaJ domain-containing protein [Thamnocephalis sphaerospora]